MSGRFYLEDFDNERGVFRLSLNRPELRNAFNDEMIEDKGVKVFIDPAAVMYLLGTQMDYKKDKFSSSFVFNNPNETERCGCGESFKI